MSEQDQPLCLVMGLAVVSGTMLLLGQQRCQSLMVACGVGPSALAVLALHCC